jgi:cell division protein FtsB
MLSGGASDVAAVNKAKRTRRHAPVVASATASWLLPFALLMFAVICVPVRLLEPEGLPRYRMLRAEREEVRAGNEKLARDVEQLRIHVARLRAEPEALERLARDDLGMLRKDELLFQFQD